MLEHYVNLHRGVVAGLYKGFSFILINGSSLLIPTSELYAMRGGKSIPSKTEIMDVRALTKMTEFNLQLREYADELGHLKNL